MTVRKQIAHYGGLYFITFTCCKWIPLFEQLQAYDEVYKQFHILELEGHFIVGYVLMPNHVHLLIAFSRKEKNINRRIGTIKRFLAYAIVGKLEKAERWDILGTLENAVYNNEREQGAKHKVFEPSFDCKYLFTPRMIRQKLNYTHRNPCRGIWHLAENPVAYIHSSAKFYETGIQGTYPVTHYLALDNIDLSS